MEGHGKCRKELGVSKQKDNWSLAAAGYGLLEADTASRLSVLWEWKDRMGSAEKGGGGNRS